MEVYKGEFTMDAAEARHQFCRGDRVWYQPSPGARFAGVVEGKGTLEGTRPVLLDAHYFQWKGTKTFRAMAYPAIPVDFLYPRRGPDAGVDRAWYIREDRRMKRSHR